MTDYVSKVSSLNLVDVCENALQAFELLKKENIDLLFLDIQMPEITGISFIKNLQHKPIVVFTTAYSEYALEGYELDVLDYLLKPVTFERFIKAVDKVTARLQTPEAQTGKGNLAEEKSKDFVFIKDGTRHIKLMLRDILFVEGLKDYVSIHTTNQKIVTLQRMKNMEELLPADVFLRIHHSYIVNMQAVDSVQKHEVRIAGKVLPVSDSYRKVLKAYIEGKQM